MGKTQKNTQTLPDNNTKLPVVTEDLLKNYTIHDENGNYCGIIQLPYLKYPPLDIKKRTKPQTQSKVLTDENGNKVKRYSNVFQYYFQQNSKIYAKDVDYIKELETDSKPHIMKFTAEKWKNEPEDVKSQYKTEYDKLQKAYKALKQQQNM